LDHFAHQFAGLVPESEHVAELVGEHAEQVDRRRADGRGRIDVPAPPGGVYVEHDRRPVGRGLGQEVVRQVGDLDRDC
jgi:hypothetical protein